MCRRLYVELLEGERRGHVLPSVRGRALRREKPLRKGGVAPCTAKSTSVAEVAGVVELLRVESATENLREVCRELHDGERSKEATRSRGPERPLKRTHLFQQI